MIWGCPSHGNFTGPAGEYVEFSWIFNISDYNGKTGRTRSYELSFCNGAYPKKVTSNGEIMTNTKKTKHAPHSIDSMSICTRKKDFGCLEQPYFERSHMKTAPWKDTPIISQPKLRNNSPEWADWQSTDPTQKKGKKGFCRQRWRKFSSLFSPEPKNRHSTKAPRCSDIRS